MAQIIGIALWALIPGFVANKKGRNFLGWYFLSFVISPLFTTIIVLCLPSKKYKISKKSIEENYNETKKNCFCRKCGAPLIQNSKFCRKCGAEIIEEQSDNRG